jgi:hypothetical protein
MAAGQRDPKRHRSSADPEKQTAADTRFLCGRHDTPVPTPPFQRFTLMGRRGKSQLTRREKEKRSAALKKAFESRRKK